MLSPLPVHLALAETLTPLVFTGEYTTNVTTIEDPDPPMPLLYDPIRPETALALFNLYVAPDVTALSDAAMMVHLLPCLPHGSIEKVELEVPGQTSSHPKAPEWSPGDGPRVLVKITERGPIRDIDDGVRWLDPMALPLMMTMSLYGGFPITDVGQAGWHYVDIGGDNRAHLHRLLVNAPPRSTVRLPPENHRDLRVRSLLAANPLLLREVTNADPQRERQRQRVYRGREFAIAEALGRHSRASASHDWFGPSRAAYRAMLDGAFALFDAHHGRKLEADPMGEAAE